MQKGCWQIAQVRRMRHPDTGQQELRGKVCPEEPVAAVLEKGHGGQDDCRQDQRTHLQVNAHGACT